MRRSCGSRRGFSQAVSAGPDRRRAPTPRRSAGWTTCAAGWEASSSPRWRSSAAPSTRASRSSWPGRSITLVRNDDGLLPFRPDAGARVVVVQSRPADLTPADTSSYVVPTLAAALRRRIPGVEEILLPPTPGEADLAGLGDRLADFDLVVAGTFSAHLQPIQATLIRAVLASGRPTVTVALRTPWDLLAYPSARTHVCSYGSQPADDGGPGSRAPGRSSVLRPPAGRDRRPVSPRPRARLRRLSPGEPYSRAMRR